MCINSWHKYLPDYEFVHWNFDRFPRGKSKWVDQAFDYHKYAFAADYIRLYALYNYGGIYLDTDVEVLKSFDDLLDLPYFIGKEPSETGIEAAVLGAEKGNILIGDMLGSYQNRSFLLPEGDMDVMPLPYKMRACIESQFFYHPIQKKEEFVNNEDYINVFPEDFFSPKDFHTLEIRTTERTYAIHHFAGSWMSPSSTSEKTKEWKATVRRWILRHIDWKNNIIMSNSNIDTMYDTSFSRQNHSPIYTARLSQEDFLKFLSRRNEWPSLILVQRRRKESKYADKIKEFYPIACIKGTDIELHFTRNFSMEQVSKIWKEGLDNIREKRFLPILVTDDTNVANNFRTIAGPKYLIITSNPSITGRRTLQVSSLKACNEKSIGRGRLMLQICMSMNFI
jgi:mannosyltransferase OCH1-like enzyme